MTHGCKVIFKISWTNDNSRSKDRFVAWSTYFSQSMRKQL